MPIPKPQILFKDIEKDCLWCGKRLRLNNTRDIKRKKFCSYSCRAKWNRKKGIYPAPPRPTKEIYKKIGTKTSEQMRLGLRPKPPRGSAESHRKQGLKMRGKNHPKYDYQYIDDKGYVDITHFYTKIYSKQ